MNVKKIISETLKIAADKTPDGQDWNLNSAAACDMLAEKIHMALLSRNLLANIVPPINLKSDK